MTEISSVLGEYGYVPIRVDLWPRERGPVVCAIRAAMQSARLEALIAA
jgi:hypothetical protein